MRLHLSINHNLLLIFTFLENAFVCAFIVYVLNFPLNPLGKKRFMEQPLGILLITLALMDGLNGQFMVQFRNSREVVYQNEVITCQVRLRIPWQYLRYLRSSISVNIVVRQRLTNGTEVDLSTCPMDRESRTYTCSARLANFQCKETVTVTCSVVDILNNTTKRSTATQINVVGVRVCPALIVFKTCVIYNCSFPLFFHTVGNPYVESFYTRYKGVTNYNSTQTFLPGALIELVCVGNISMATTQQNLTLSRRYGILHSQDPPSVKSLKTWDKECTIHQQVSVFLYLKEEGRSYSEFRCETKSIYRYFGRYSQTSRKSIRIKTENVKNYIQGPEFVTTDELEDRVLLSMTCEAMTDEYNSTDIKDIRWCIKKENDTQYVSLPLQEKPNDETFNVSLGRKLKSVVLYQLSKSDRNVEIICETNYSETCGSGALSSYAFFNEYSMEKTPSASAATDAMFEHPLVYIAIVMMVVGIASLVAGIIAYYKANQRAKHKISSSVLNISSSTKCDVQTTELENLKGQGKQEDQFYENILVKSVRGSKPAYVLNDTHTGAASEMYEAIDENAQYPHIYEEKCKSGELYEVV